MFELTSQTEANPMYFFERAGNISGEKGKIAKQITKQIIVRNTDKKHKNMHNNTKIRQYLILVIEKINK